MRKIVMFIGFFCSIAISMHGMMRYDKYSSKHKQKQKYIPREIKLFVKKLTEKKLWKIRKKIVRDSKFIKDRYRWKNDMNKYPFFTEEDRRRYNKAHNRWQLDREYYRAERGGYKGFLEFKVASELKKDKLFIKYRKSVKEQLEAEYKISGRKMQDVDRHYIDFIAVYHYRYIFTKKHLEQMLEYDALDKQKKVRKK